MLLNKFSILLFTIFIFCNTANAGNPFQLIKAADKDVPYIIQLMINHLEQTKISFQDTREIILDMNLINKNLKQLDRANTVFLATSESYKSFLNYKFDIVLSRNAIMNSQIIMIQNKLKKNDLVYTSFAKFIITSIIEDFDEFMVGNFLTRYQNKSSAVSKNYVKIQKLKKIVKYNGPWIHSISSNPPTFFNNILNDVIKTFLNNLAQQSRIFELNRGNQTIKTNRSIFSGLDSPEVVAFLKPKDQDDSQNDTKNPQDSAKSEAKDAIKNLNVQDPKVRSKDIKNLMNEIDENR